MASAFFMREQVKCHLGLNSHLNPQVGEEPLPSSVWDLSQNSVPGGYGLRTSVPRWLLAENALSSLLCGTSPQGEQNKSHCLFITQS